MSDRATFKVFLIQVRADNVASLHERECIMEVAGLGPDQVDFVNLATQPLGPEERYADADLVMIGGSASHSVVNDDPFTEELVATVRRIVDRRQPLLGSCWGHQFIARALGGEVVTDVARAEVGLVEVQATAAGRADPVFGALPERYPVLMGHHDHVVRLPAGCQELAFSGTCRNQAFTLEGHPVYGTQFHCELLPEQLVARLTMFRQYMPDDDEFEALKAAMRPTPDAGRIMGRLIDLIRDA